MLVLLLDLVLLLVVRRGLILNVQCPSQSFIMIVILPTTVGLTVCHMTSEVAQFNVELLKQVLKLIFND